MTDDPRVSSLKSQSRNGRTVQDSYLFKVAHVGDRSRRSGIFHRCGPVFSTGIRPCPFTADLVVSEIQSIRQLARTSASDLL